MSTALYQSMFYGYKTTYDKFKEIEGEVEDEAWDDLMAENRENGIGWILTEDNQAVYGKLILEGESYGNGSAFAAESGIVEVPLPNINEAERLRTMIYAKIPWVIMGDEIQFYIVGDWG